MFRISFLLCALLLVGNNFARAVSFKVGLAKTDITSYREGAGMLGYGMSFNVVEGVQTRLYARSFVLEDAQQQRIAIVVCELCFIPSELKSGIISRLQQDPATKDLTAENVLIMAQHTHSAPGGYCHYASYNMSIPGYIPELYDTLCMRIAGSVIEAGKVLRPCSIRLSSGLFPEDWEVAFNRSLAAYNNNKDIQPLVAADRHKAVNRAMTLLHFEGEDGTPLGSVNWFGVHATNISNDNKLINADNKGYAAAYLEAGYEARNAHYVGAFAQGTAGDVTPKFVYNAQRHWQRGYWEGKYPDDIASAEYNGELQYKKAKELIEAAQQYELPATGIHSVLRYIDFSKIVVDTMYSHTAAVQATGPSCVGLSMLGGALMDGPGAAPAVLGMAKAAIRSIKKAELLRTGLRQDEWADAIRLKYRVQGKKDIVLETGDKKLLGTRNVKGLIIPGFTDPAVAAFKRFDRLEALEENSWSPQILPVQLLQVGDVVLAAFPFEITTTAGRRLKKSITELYAGDHIKEVILCPYANSYSGYITTYEEYQQQMYEGGHCVFGEYSLAALQTVFRQLYQERKISFSALPDPLQPPVFSSEELAKRSFYRKK